MSVSRVASLAVACLLLPATALAQPSFSIEVVVPDARTDCNPSLAIGPDGAPTIAYNAFPLRVMLAHPSGGVWATEEVSIHASVFATRALALTSSGDPVVAFSYGDHARVAKRSNGVWSYEDFDIPYSPWWLTLALDRDDRSHTSYVWSWGSGDYEGFFGYDREDLSGNVFLPTNTSCSLAMDSGNHPHIVFTPTEGAPMQYWTKPGFTWLSEPLPVGTWGVLALDAADTPHMVYYDHVAGDLVYGTRTAQGWTFEPVDVDGDVGKLPSLVLDAAGRPHVGYYDVTHQDLEYATKESGAWTVVAVDHDGDVGLPSSMALVSGTRPAIAYFDATRREIKLALASETVPVRPITWGALKALYGERQR